MRTLRTFSCNNFHISYGNANFIYHTVLYIPALINLITESLYPLIAGLIPLPPTSTSGNHKSDPFFYEFVFEV